MEEELYKEEDIIPNAFEDGKIIWMGVFVLIISPFLIVYGSIKKIICG